MAKKTRTQLKGDLFLLTDSEQSFATAQIDLLMAIDDCGSISQAAKQLGISYKTAWDRIDTINNMSDKPLIVRNAGGAQGGGSSLTELGKQMISGFLALKTQHKDFVQRLGSKLHSLTDVANFIRSGTMTSSARNQFRGQVIQIEPGTVNTQVVLRLSDSQTVTAMITNESLQQLGFELGSHAIALVKASWVLLSTDLQLKTSARNQLIGRIARISQGAINSDISVDLGDGKSISAIITNTSVTELGLRQGDRVCALFKASSVILMAD